MPDTVIVYIAGKEMSRGQATPQGHVTHNQQTYVSVIDFYNDSIHKCLPCEFDDLWWKGTKQWYNNCYGNARTTNFQDSWNLLNVNVIFQIDDGKNTPCI